MDQVAAEEPRLLQRAKHQHAASAGLQPAHPWEFARWKPCKVDRYCYVPAGGRYSVQSGLMGRQVWVALGVRTVEVMCDGASRRRRTRGSPRGNGRR